jgi:hypothetical protein
MDLGDLRRWYRRVECVDFEFTAPPGEQQTPICCVSRELFTGEVRRLWLADGAPDLPPYGTGSDTLFVAYYASAELQCHLALDWPMPARILDLHAEFRRRTSGLPVPCGHGLLGALTYYGLDAMTAVEKEEWRAVAIRGGPFTDAERQGLLDYCQSDTDALVRVLPRMSADIDLPRALLRGRYMAAVSRMEWAGVPIDAETLKVLREHWDTIKARLIAAVDADYGVFVPVEQRSINPASRYGAAILETAAEWGIDPHYLADAADSIWRRERDRHQEGERARQKARKATGLNAATIRRWEHTGRDHSLFPDLDAIARDLAGTSPELGLGPAYTEEEDAIEKDFGAELWERLKTPAAAAKPKYDPDILREAAEEVSSCAVDGDYGFGPRRFSSARWAEYLAKHQIPWPRLESGALALDDDTFREMARTYPEQVGPIRELRHTLGQMRLNDLSVGSDGRARCMLSTFGSRTGRNQPSNTRFVFGPSCWLRSIIRPLPGWAIAYCDWSAQELGIAAYLSGDLEMQTAYRSGDPYLWLAKKAGAVPADATKKTHATDRDRFKVVSLGVLYGLSGDGLARKLGLPLCHGHELLRMHQRIFRRFWEWSDMVEAQGMLTSELHTPFGWAVHVGPDANPRSLRNFPMQGTGSDMMRLACCLATERGNTVCCPVHDALLVEGPDAEIETVVAETQRAMSEASELCLPGFPLRTDAKIVRWPDRYMDPRGEWMWETVQGILAETASGYAAFPLVVTQRSH